MLLKTFDELLREYLERISPTEPVVYDEKARAFVEENRRICNHRAWFTTSPPICVHCGLVGNIE